MQLVNLMWNNKYLLNSHFNFIGFSDLGKDLGKYLGKKNVPEK